MLNIRLNFIYIFVHEDIYEQLPGGVCEMSTKLVLDEVEVEIFHNCLFENVKEAFEEIKRIEKRDRMFYDLLGDTVTLFLKTMRFAKELEEIIYMLKEAAKWISFETEDGTQGYIIVTDSYVLYYDVKDEKYNIMISEIPQLIAKAIFYSIVVGGW